MAKTQVDGGRIQTAGAITLIVGVIITSIVSVYEPSRSADQIVLGWLGAFALIGPMLVVVGVGILAVGSSYLDSSGMSRGPGFIEHTGAE